MTVPLAVQSIVQNQVDQVLKETRKRQLDYPWKRQDLRNVTASVRREHKKTLLSDIPSLLSGYLADTISSHSWLPIYILSACVPHSELIETSYSTDLVICNVVWQQYPSQSIAVSFFNNHLDSHSSFAHFSQAGLSTNRNSSWAVGKNGSGFIRACHYLMSKLQSESTTGTNPRPFGVSLRVGHVAGYFAWYFRACRLGPQLHLLCHDLSPLSLKIINTTPGKMSSLADRRHFIGICATLG